MIQSRAHHLICMATLIQQLRFNPRLIARDPSLDLKITIVSLSTAPLRAFLFVITEQVYRMLD